MNTDVGYNDLLTRQQFKEFGFRRTNGMCCIEGCCEKAVDAHHIMDRKLWKDGGYYLSNCAPVCEKHHIDCENGTISPRRVMEQAKIDIQYLQKPDAIDWLSDDEYRELFTNEELDKFGRLIQ